MGFQILPDNKIHPESFHGQFNRALSYLNDGTNGYYRAPQKYLLVDINTDQNAIELYCTHYVPPSEARFSRSILERLQLWAVLIQHKAVSDLGLDDYCAYIDFIQDPPENWISQKQNLKGTMKWRPFTSITRTDYERKLSKRTHTNCLTIRRFIRWTNDAGYLIGNPMSLAMDKMQPPKREFKKLNPAVLFPGENIMFWLLKANRSYPYNPKFKAIYEPRAELIMCLLYHMNVHLRDMPMARMADFRCIEDTWFFCSNPEHYRSFSMPIGLSTLEALKQWRSALGLSYYPSSSETYALFPPIHRFGTPLLKRSGIRIDSINNTLIGIIRLAAEQTKGYLPELAMRLNSATASWIRFKGQYDRKTGAYYRHHADEL